MNSLRLLAVASVFGLAFAAVGQPRYNFSLDEKVMSSTQTLDSTDEQVVILSFKLTETDTNA